MMVLLSSARATTKGLSQIVTPDLQKAGDLSLSFQVQSERIANPYELQAEMGLTNWAEFAVFRGFKPDDWIFGTEFGLLTKEPYLLSVGFVNWSPHLDVDPQPYIEAGYYTEHQKFIVGAIHAGYKNEAILGYAYDFNRTWRVQVDFQSGGRKLIDHRLYLQHHPRFPDESRPLYQQWTRARSVWLRRFHLYLSSLGARLEGRS
jgi:hypothetical protein